MNRFIELNCRKESIPRNESGFASLMEIVHPHTHTHKKVGACNVVTRKKHVLRKKCGKRVFLYRVSEPTYNQKSDDLEICHV